MSAPAASPGLGGYLIHGGGFDELLAADGRPRPHWEALLDALATVGDVELARRRDRLRRQLRDQGAHEATGTGLPSEAPRALDPLPLVIQPADWQTLAGGLAQRARLLDRWLADCYGAQATLRDAVVPPALVLGDPAFLRPCHGVAVPGGRWLHLVAFDCVRAPDGTWRVLRQLTGSAPGLGLALENRILLSRTLPEGMRARPVQRLASYFATLLDVLRALAPAHRELPRIVLLTPGPADAAWPEHAYLARYLGLGLVEGGDLTVRDRAVYLKTLGGLERVDVVLRRVEDAACDPLSLGSEATTGVAGLVQAVRAGRVALANALGSELGEIPGLTDHLPALCRRLLGEDLLLADARVGDPPATAPCWTPDGLVAAPVVLRAWVVAERDGGHRVLPGGLARVLDAPGIEPGTTKDTWVLSEGPVDALSLLPPPDQPVTLTRGGAELPSRVADDLFWLGRHVERAEGVARLLRAMLRRLADEAGSADGATLGAMAAALAALAEVPQGRVRRPGGGVDERTLGAFLAADAPPGALRAAVGAAWRLGARVRDQISLDTWRILQRLERQIPVASAHEPLPLGAALDALDGLVLTLAAFSGLGVENLTRGLGWRFADMGRRIERARATAALVASTLVEADDDDAPLLEAALEVTDVAMTYRRRYPAVVQLVAVLDLVLLDETSPRSLAFQLIALENHVARLPRDPRRALRSAEERLAMAAVTRVRLANLGALCTAREGGRRVYLSGVCESVVADLSALSDALTHAFLSHADLVAQPLGGAG